MILGKTNRFVDIMFFDEKQFMYEPDYYNWKDAVETEEWEFESIEEEHADSI